MQSFPPTPAMPFLCGGARVFTLNAQTGESPQACVKRAQALTEAHGLEIFHGALWGAPQKAFFAEDIPFPCAVLGRHDAPDDAFFGGRFEALPHGAFAWARDGAGTVGAVWETPSARYLWAGALTPADTRQSPKAQAQAVWTRMESLLSAHGFSVRDIVRTWFYNNRILDWYKDFNDVRTSFFKKHGVFEHFVPASTGIGAANHAGAALCAGFLAAAPKAGAQGGVCVRAAPSPLQCPAYDYASAFSRAATVDSPEGRLLLVSGTASIEPNGKTAHAGDLDAQIDLTLRVVGAILSESGMRWADVARAVAYFPKIEHMGAFARRREAAGIAPFPCLLGYADVCRGDLMFELELDAVRAPPMHAAD